MWSFGFKRKRDEEKKEEKEDDTNVTPEKDTEKDEIASPATKKQRSSNGPAPSFITSSPAPKSRTSTTTVKSPTQEERPSLLASLLRRSHDTPPPSPLVAPSAQASSVPPSPSNKEKEGSVSKSFYETIFSPMFSFLNYSSRLLGQEDVDETNFHEQHEQTHQLPAPLPALSSTEILNESTEEDEVVEEPVVEEPPEQPEVKEETVEEEDVFDPYLFIRNLPELALEQTLALVPALPAKNTEDPRLTLVLDLDETLVHCSTESLENFDHSFPVVFKDVKYKVFARRRPYLEEFLDYASKRFELVVFTASQQVYANKLLDILDPQRRIKYRLFRDACICVDGNYLKDLRILNRDLAQVIIVDNSPQAFGYQLDNGIPIESWFEDTADEELIKLVPFLDSLLESNDVRPFIKNKYKLHEVVQGISQRTNQNTT